MMVLIIIFSTNIYAKYAYNFNLQAFSLTRDNSEITYDINKNISEEYTNKDILLSINLNKSIDIVGEGNDFEISEDGKTLTRLVTENESKTINVEDISGNKKEITYSINNIDKTPPEIIGVEDGETYNENKAIDYNDNVGIKDICVEKYSNLVVQCQDEFYDKSNFKGISVLGKSINVKILSHPKFTKYYKYYLNDTLIEEKEEQEFTFTQLDFGTNYVVKVEAIGENGNILDFVTRNLKTKYFETIDTIKTSDSFKITLSGLDSRVKCADAVGIFDANNRKNLKTSIDSEGNISITLNAKEVTPGIVKNGYYFLVFELYTENYRTLLESLRCNIRFDETYDENLGKINPYNLSSNGEYEIVVTDLAGNITKKNIIINK